jgi:ATP-dependent helicase/nuclease subunit A
MSSQPTTRLSDEADRQQAVTTSDHAFVWASAGTGKTHTLTLRALYLLLNAPFLFTGGETSGSSLYTSPSRPERLLAARSIIKSLVLTTFTRKAAAEMQTRLFGYLNSIAAARDRSDLEARGDPKDLLFHEVVKIVLKNLAESEQPSGMPPLAELNEGPAFAKLRAGAQALTELAAELQISTIHSFATSLLRRYPLEAGIPPTARFAKEDEDDQPGIDEQVVGRWWERQALGHPEIQNDLEELLQVVSVSQIRHWLKQCYSCDWILEESAGLPLEDLDEERGVVAAGYALVQALEKEETSKLTRMRDRFQQILDNIGTHRPGSWQELCRFIQADKRYFFADGKPTKAVGAALDSLGPEHSRYFQSWLNLYLPASRLCVAKEFSSAWEIWIRLVGRFVKWLDEDAIQELGLVTFDDMIRLAVRLLKEHPAVRRAEQRRLRALLVDEFQDTDPLQLDLFKALLQNDAESSHEVLGFFVGDTKQSIYRFRGVDVPTIEDFHERYETHTGCQLGRSDFQLRTSFRSVKKVTQFVNHFFDRELKLAEEEAQLIPHRPDPGDLPEWHLIDSDSEGEGFKVDQERDFSAAETLRIIQQYLEKEDCSYRDILVLVRDWKEVDALLPVLQGNGIPTISSGAKTFHRHPEVLDVLNLLIALLHPQDRLAVAALLRSPLVCLSDPQIHTLLQEVPPEELLHSRQPLPDHLPETVQARLGLLRELALHRRDQSTELSLSDWLSQVRRLVPQPLYSQPGDQEGRPIVRIDRVFETFKEASHRSATPPLVWLLKQRSRAAQIDRWDGDPGEDITLSDESVNAVRVMTIHKAKGLEARFVIVYGWTSVLLNLGEKRRGKQGSPEVISVTTEKAVPLRAYSMDWGPLKVISPGYPEALAEEGQAAREEAKRLAYVATTRARDGLVLMCPVSKGRHFTEEIQHFLQSATDAIPAQAQQLEAVVLNGLLRFTHHPGFQAQPTSHPSRPFEVDEEKYKALWETRYAQVQSPLPSVLRRPSDPEHRKEDETLEEHHYRGRTGPPTALLVGQLVHAYLERYLLDDGLDENKLHRLASESMKETIELASRTLSDFYSGTLKDTAQRAYLDRTRTGTVLARELPVYLVHGDATWNGVIDLVLEEDDVIRAIDYKATVVKDPLPEGYRQQEQIYTEALRRAFPERKIGFEFWWLGRADG